MIDAPPPPPAPPAPPPAGPPTGWSQPGAASPPPPRSSRPGLWVGVAIVSLVALVAALLVVGKTIGSPRSPAAGVSFTDPTNHFSASFQGKPVEDHQTVGVVGGQVAAVLWSNIVDKDVGEVVGYATYPADYSFAAPNSMLAGAMAGEAGNLHGTLVSTAPGTYQGFRSIDGIILAAGGYVESRVIIAGRTLFIVLVTSTHNPPELFATFVASLRILDHAS